MRQQAGFCRQWIDDRAASRLSGDAGAAKAKEGCDHGAARTPDRRTESAPARKVLACLRGPGDRPARSAVACVARLSRVQRREAVPSRDTSLLFLGWGLRGASWARRSEGRRVGVEGYSTGEHRGGQM